MEVRLSPGLLGKSSLDIISAFQAYGEFLSNKIDDEERVQVIQKSCPGAGACAGMYTANTMASAIEVMGMSLPFSSSMPAIDPGKLDECRRAGAALKNLLEKDIKPSDILTRTSFENAMGFNYRIGWIHKCGIAFVGDGACRASGAYY